MKNNKVCIIAKYHYPGCTRLEQQVAVLTENRIPVEIICLRDSGQPRFQKIGSIEVHRIKRAGVRGGLKSYLFDTINFSWAAFKKLQQIPSEDRSIRRVIVVHTLPEFMLFIGIIQKLRGASLVLDIRDISYELFKTKWGHGIKSFLLPVVKFVEKITCKLSDRILVASPGFYNRLIARGVPSDKMTVVYNTADESIFKYNPDRQFKKIEDSAILFYHGTIAERFGVEVAIDTLHLLLERIPNSKLVVHGWYDRPYFHLIKQMIDTLSLQDNISINGPLHLKEIYKLVDEASFGIVPYQNDEFMNLAFSTKMFEYSAAGLPIVASDLKPARIAYDDTCVSYCEPGNPADFAEKIVHLCMNPDQRKQKSQNARAAYEQVSSNVMSQRYLEVIRSQF